MKKWSQNKEKRGETRSFCVQLIHLMFCDLKSLASLKTFKSTCGGRLFLIKLQVFNCNCSEKKKNAPLEVFLRFYIPFNGCKSQNGSHICPFLQREQLRHMI